MTRSGIDSVRSLVSSTARAYTGLRVRQLGSVAAIACADGRRPSLCAGRPTAAERGTSPTARGGIPTRKGRILFSFGNRESRCADHSSRQGIRCRMPGLQPPSISEFQPLIVRSRTTRFFGLPGRAGQPRTRTEDHRSKETILGRIRLPESHLLSFSLIFWLGKAEIGAAAPLRQAATTTFRRHLAHDGGRDAKRPIYTSVRMLKTRPKTCHFLPLFAPRCAQKRAEASHRISNRRWRIGTGRCVVRRCQKKVANTRGKVAQVNPVVVHYV